MIELMRIILKNHLCRILESGLCINGSLTDLPYFLKNDPILSICFCPSFFISGLSLDFNS